MRKLFTALGLALATAGAMTFPPAATPASAQAAISISLFFGELAPHGRWFRHPRWGWAWFPTAVDANWRPYARGQWAWTEENGWYWISDEPFGWAVYHYGRWAYDAEYGWIWIPGSTWGPAWVAFRESDDYFGWAPLPPETLGADYGWQESYTSLDASYYQPRWMFVPRRHFLARRAYIYAAPVQRNAFIIRASHDTTRYERGRRGVFNRGFEPRRLEAALGRRITPLRVNVVNNPRRVGPDPAGRRVNVFRPNVRISRDAAPPQTMRARPQDRPRVRIQRNAVAPSDRRERAAPPTAPGTQPPAMRTPQTTAPRTATPPSVLAPPRTPQTATPPSFTTRPGTPPRAPQQDRERSVRRTAPQGPGHAAPSAPHAAPPAQPPRMAAPPQPPRAPEARRERQAMPAPRPDRSHPPATFGPPAPRSAPPSFARPSSPPRSAPPSFARPSSPPPRMAPSAGPTMRAHPPAAKPAPPTKAPPAKAPPSKKDEGKGLLNR